MLHLDADTKYFWFQGSADFRKGFNGLCGLVKEYLQTDVIYGGVFIFLNRRRNAIKLLKWEGDGLAIYHKRLEQGVFEEPKKSNDGRQMIIDADQLSLILQGIRLSSVKRHKRFSFRR
jgi:transposase